MSAQQLVYALLQRTVMGTVVFLFLLIFKRHTLKCCGICVWHLLIITTLALYAAPMSLLKIAVYPALSPLRLWTQRFFSRFHVRGDVIISIKPLPNTSLYETLLIVWLCGAATFLVTHCILSLASMSRRRKNLLPASGSVTCMYFDRLLADAELSKIRRLNGVELFVHNDVYSPTVYGFLKKKIVLPALI